MCTLSFVPREQGYSLAMNRDERIARGAGLSPEISECDGESATYPGDGAGGTWIAVNQSGITLALLNLNDEGRGRKTASRGKVIPALIASKSLEDLQRSISRIDLAGMLPFRLIGIFPEERQICEWSWRSEAIALQSLEWKSEHWFSSSLSDQLATERRGAECSRAWKQADAGSTAWLRKLHASHSGELGFSLCVHRDEVQTLSYTEISYTPARVEMGHMMGSPCAQGPIQLLVVEKSAIGKSQSSFLLTCN